VCLGCQQTQLHCHLGKKGKTAKKVSKKKQNPNICRHLRRSKVQMGIEVGSRQRQEQLDLRPCHWQIQRFANGAELEGKIARMLCWQAYKRMVVFITVCVNLISSSCVQMSWLAIMVMLLGWMSWGPCTAMAVVWMTLHIVIRTWSETHSALSLSRYTNTNEDYLVCFK